MKLGRANFYPAFRPAGVFAGGRFVLRRFTAVPRRHTWSRIVLRWRKTRQRNLQTRISARRAAVAQSHTRAAKALSRVSYFQQFHLHFALAGRDQLRRPSKPIQVRLYGERTHRAQSRKRGANEILLRQASGPGLFREVIPRTTETIDQSPIVPADARARSKDEVGIAQPAQLPQLTWHTKRWSSIARRLGPSFHPVLSRHIDTPTPKTRSTTPIEQPGSAGRRRTVETWELGQLSRRLSRNEIADIVRRDRNRESDVVASPAKRSVPLLSRRPRGREFARSADGKNTELIWRRSSPMPSEKQSLDADGTGDTNHSRNAPNSASANNSLPDVERLIERVAVKQMTKLDPALLDRLTDNVISRVEKRIKIERQRRGL